MWGFVILGVLTLLNACSFALYGIDKRKAQIGAYRISEDTLLRWAFFAPWGAYAGMQVFRHKTQHERFTTGVPLRCVGQVALIAIIAVIWMKCFG